jgi:hypothetical protein
MTIATGAMIGAAVASTRSPVVVNVVWRERSMQRPQATKAKADGYRAQRLTAKQYAKLQQLAAANTRELTGSDRF